MIDALAVMLALVSSPAVRDPSWGPNLADEAYWQLSGCRAWFKAHPAPPAVSRSLSTHTQPQTSCFWAAVGEMPSDGPICQEAAALERDPAARRWYAAAHQACDP